MPVKQRSARRRCTWTGRRRVGQRKSAIRKCAASRRAASGGTNNDTRNPANSNCDTRMRTTVRGAVRRRYGFDRNTKRKSDSAATKRIAKRKISGRNTSNG